MPLRVILASTLLQPAPSPLALSLTDSTVTHCVNQALRVRLCGEVADLGLAATSCSVLTLLPRVLLLSESHTRPRSHPPLCGTCLLRLPVAAVAQLAACVHYARVGGPA